MRKFTNTAEDRVEFLDERFYMVGEDTYYPSVTTILNMYPKGPEFLQWIKDVGNQAKQIAQRAADSGSKVHNAAEKLIAGEELVWDDKEFDLNEWQGVLRFVDFFKRFQPEVFASEVTVISHEHKYAGSLDIGCKLLGENWLIDIKFGNAIYPTYYMQLAAYRAAWDESHKEKIEKMGVLHLKAATRTEGRKGSIQGLGWQLVQPKDEYGKLLDMFFKVKGIYDYENPESKPKNFTLPNKVKL